MQNCIKNNAFGMKEYTYKKLITYTYAPCDYKKL